MIDVLIVVVLIVVFFFVSVFVSYFVFVFINKTSIKSFSKYAFVIFDVILLLF